MKTLHDVQDLRWKASREEHWNRFLSHYKRDYRSVKKRELAKLIFMGEVNPLEKNIQFEGPDYELEQKILLSPHQCEENWREWVGILSDTSVDLSQRKNRAHGILLSGGLNPSLDEFGWNPRVQLAYFENMIGMGYRDCVLDQFGLEARVHPENVLQTVSTVIGSILKGNSDPENVPLDWVDWYIKFVNEVNPEIFSPDSSRMSNGASFHLDKSEMANCIPQSVSQDITKNSTAIMLNALHFPSVDYGSTNPKMLADCYKGVSAEEFAVHPALRDWRSRIFEYLSTEKAPSQLVELSKWLSVHEGNEGYLFEITMGRRKYAPADQAGTILAREWQEHVEKFDKCDSRQQNAHKKYVEEFSKVPVLELFDSIESLAKEGGLKPRGWDWLKKRAQKTGKDRLHDLVDSLRPLAKRKTMGSLDSRGRALHILYPEYCYEGFPLDLCDPDPTNNAFEFFWEFVAKQLKAEYGKGVAKVKILGRQHDGEPLSYRVSLKLEKLEYVQEYDHLWDEEELFDVLRASLQDFSERHELKHRFYMVKLGRSFDRFGLYYFPESFSSLLIK